MMRKLILLALGLALGGCALNALQVEYAGNVSAKGKIAVAATRTYLGKVSASRELANLDLVGLDANCMPDIAYLRMEPALFQKDAKGEEIPVASLPRGWLCDAEEKPGSNIAFSLAPIGRELEPTIELLDSLSLYFEAIDKILTPQGPSPKDDLAAAISLAQSGDALLHAIVGGKPVLPAKDSARSKAILGFGNFLAELLAEDDKARQLQRLAASDAGSAQLVAALLDHLRAWEDSRASNERTRTITAFVIMDRQLRGKQVMTPSARQDVVKTYYTRAAADLEASRLYPALAGALKELDEADAALRRVLAGGNRLTDADRIKLARITRDRVGRAFDTLAALILSFRGS
ncbi:hypothetical protein P1X14_16960 [Sphingomonas sp. AOB5]|uniref:hypothetical protein n=1 Tax=Sphingomonas sp. AOB5 TaxID=3034017 RepID=UPI0023F84406|nr:hypothetical protein [Sphingomonas sp. AOB5]MDF7776950.1 hypothetical protein [Sphingomonas sp. AOB5]